MSLILIFIKYLFDKIAIANNYKNTTYLIVRCIGCYTNQLTVTVQYHAIVVTLTVAIGLCNCSARFSESFVVHSTRSCADREGSAMWNWRIKVNFARLTRNHCTTRVPTLTRADPRLSPKAIDIDTITTLFLFLSFSLLFSRYADGFPVIQHRSIRPQIICILSRHFEHSSTNRARRARNFSLPLALILRFHTCVSQYR